MSLERTYRPSDSVAIARDRGPGRSVSGAGQRSVAAERPGPDLI
jgi:hypothetical protein